MVPDMNRQKPSRTRTKILLGGMVLVLLGFLFLLVHYARRDDAVGVVWGALGVLYAAYVIALRVRTLRGRGPAGSGPAGR